MIADAIDDNLDRIRGDLVRRGLSYEPLVDDLLDHVCCMLEDAMKAGSDFDTSYKEVLETIGDKRLPEIQHHTLLNLDKKYQKMKNFTYLSGITSVLLIFVGAFFKWMHFPGAAAIFSLGILISVLVFLPLYFISSYREQTEKMKPVLFIAGYLILATMLTGILFKIMHWPASGILITMGIGLIILLVLPYYLITNYRKQEEKKNSIYPIVGYITLALILAGALFKIMHWPGAGMMIEVGIGFVILGFTPLYLVGVFQRSGGGRLGLPFLVMFLVGISFVMLITTIRISWKSEVLYVHEAQANEQGVSEIRERTTMLVEMTSDSSLVEKQASVTSIHQQASELLTMIDDMKHGIVALFDLTEASLDEFKGKEFRRSRVNALKNYDAEQAFVQEAKAFESMLETMLLDPVVRNQIRDHLEFIEDPDIQESSIRYNPSEPMSKFYHQLTDASLGIALTEYVAIDYMLDH
jgi:hypothetical protein